MSIGDRRLMVEPAVAVVPGVTCPVCKRRGVATTLVPVSQLGALRCPAGGERFVPHGRRGLRQVSA